MPEACLSCRTTGTLAYYNTAYFGHRRTSYTSVLAKLIYISRWNLADSITFLAILRSPSDPNE